MKVIVYAICILVATVICIFVAISYLLGWTGTLNSSVMAPTIPQGSSVRMFRFLGNPKRYEIIMFEMPGRSDHLTSAMRVIGLPGERIHLTTNGIFVDGAKLVPPLAMKYEDLVLPDPYARIGVTGEFLIPPRAFFVLGDNLANALDSRYVGVINRGSIKAVVKP